MKKKALVSSILTIALCLSLIAGSTFALFTSTDSVNVAVTAGKVEVVATIDGLQTYSMGNATEVNGTFANGGTATFTDAKELVLDKVTPGDKASFNVNITNNSNVVTSYRIKMYVEGELANALVATATIDASDVKLSAVESVTDWATFDGNETIVVPMSVLLPVEAGNEYQEKSARVTVVVEAVQANGTELYGKTVVSGLAGLLAALSDTSDANIVALSETLVIDKEVEIDLNGKALEGDFELVEGAVVTISNGTLDNNDSSVSAFQVNGGKLTLNNVVIESSRHAVRVEGGELVINGGIYKVDGTAGKTQNAINVGEPGLPTKVIINGGMFIGPKGTAADSGAALAVKADATVEINGGSFSGGKNNTLSVKGTLAVKGGAFDQDPTAYVADGYRVGMSDDSKFVVAPLNDNSVVIGSEELKEAIANGETEITLTPGTYEFPSNMSKEGLTIIGQEGVVFEDTLSGTLNNTTIKNVHIKAGNAQRWAYSHGTLVFENCTFEATGVYAIHYDALNGANITYKNCKIIGWVAIGGGAEHITFDGCEIYGNGRYGVIRLYSEGTIKNCTFDVAAVNTTDVYQDGIHAVDCNIDLSNNTNVNGDMVDLYNTSGTATLTENGVVVYPN